MTDESAISVANYCVSFIDLLGQRDALRGQGLLPIVSSEREKQKLIATLRASVGSIARLQTQAADLMRASTPKLDSSVRAALPHDQKIILMRCCTQKLKLSAGRMVSSHLRRFVIKK